MTFSSASKIFGLILVISGILIIVFTLSFSYNIFMGKNTAPEIFKMENQGANLAGSVSSSDLQAQFQKIVEDQMKNLIPADSIAKILNLTVWSLLAFIFIYGGTQIANIGIKLIKT